MLYLAFVALFFILWGCFYVALPLLRHAGGAAARLIARASVRYARIGRFTNWFRAYAPIALIVIVGALATAWFGDQFLDLAELVHSKSEKLQDFDALAHAWAISKRTVADTSFFATMSNIGSPVGMGAIAACVAIALGVTRRFRWLLYLAVTAGGGSLLNLELKRYFARARPDIAQMLRQAHGYSFPSGHAIWKTACLALAWTLILGIALSRVYLGVHWSSDVAAGIAAGALWVSVTTLAYETLRRIRMLRGRRTSGP